MPRPKGSKNKLKTISPVVVDSQPTYETVLIPAQKLTYDPMNMREGIGDTPDTEFKEDIEENGITNPLLVRPIEHGKYGVVAGSRRFSKGINAGLKEFPCIVRDMDDITALSRSICENVYQKPIEAYVYQRIFNKLYCMIEKANPKLTKNEVIAVMHKQTGKAESTIKGYLAIAEKATEETKEAMRTGKLGDSRTAQDVARLPKEKQKATVQQIEGKPRSTAHEMIQHVKNETKALTGKKPKPKPQPQPEPEKPRITLASFDHHELLAELVKRNLRSDNFSSEEMEWFKTLYLQSWENMSFVDKTKCKGCGSCVDSCPVQRFKLVKGKAQIQHKTEYACIGCYACQSVCPYGAIKIVEHKVKPHKSGKR